MEISIQINANKEPAGRDAAKREETENYKKIILRAAGKTLSFLGMEGKSLGILLTGDNKMRRLNNQFRNTDSSTDVLSFPCGENGSSYLGDIAISLNKAREQAKIYKEIFENELARLVIHGILHLSGEKDYSPAEKKNMWDKQEEILKLTKTKNKKDIS